MSFRTWLQIVVAGFIALCLGWASWSVFSSYQQNHAYERQDAAQHYTDTTEGGANSCGSVMDESGVFNWLTCLADNVSADGGVKQSEYDLKAQQDMAAWALGMLIATLWLNLITFAGVIYIWRTLIATQEMASDAKKIGMAQTRAYISVEGAEFVFGKLGGLIEVELKNWGQTPGTKVKISGTSEFDWSLSETVGSVTVRKTRVDWQTFFGTVVPNSTAIVTAHTFEEDIGKQMFVKTNDGL